MMSRRAVLFGGCVVLASCGGGGGEGAPPISGPAPAPSPSPTPSPTPPPTPTPAPPPVTRRVDFSFDAGLGPWQAGYSDYTPGMEATIGFSAGYARLPAPLDASAGYRLESSNRSDDVFMYIWREVSGLEPNTRFRIDVDITFATSVPAGCSGIGGAPGEGVFIKAGGSPVEPMSVVRGNGVTTNFDHGGQAQSGRDVVNIGDFSGGGGGCGDGQGIYRRKSLSTGGRGPVFTSDASGRLWLVIGTDSGFEGFTRIYYFEGRATLTPV